MLNSQKILQYMEEHNAEFITILENLVKLESPTYGRRKIKDKCANYIVELFDSLGCKIEKIDQGETGFHIHGEIGNGTDIILLVGHYDTVFDEGEIENMPFYIEDNKAHGPGIYDMKGGIVQFYMSIKALKELNLLKDKKIEFVFNADEEAGSITSKDIIQECAKRAKACLVTEPGFFDLNGITTERYGRSVVTIKAKGVAGHAGNRPDYASNPITELTYQWDQLNACNDLEAGLTFTAVGIHGGDMKPTALIPETAYMILDIRYKSMDLYHKSENILKSLKPKMDRMSIEILGGLEKEPLIQNEKGMELIMKAKMIGNELGFDIEPRFKGGGSDGNFTSAIGCPTLDGLGLNGEFLHNPKEYVIIDTIPKRTALVAELIRII